MNLTYFVTLVFIVFLLFAYLFQRKSQDCSEKEKMIEALVRQTARWTVASQQDKSPMIALLHANYGAGYLQALELIASENEINDVMNLQTLRSKVYTTQDKAAQRVMQTCPQYIGKDIDKDLARLGINVQ